MYETWLYYYDPETKKQSMEWRHGGSQRPKNFECKNLLENFSHRFLRSRRDPSQLLSPKVPTYKHGVFLISVGAIGGVLEEKFRGNFTTCVLFLHYKAPAHRPLETQKKLAYLDFQKCHRSPYSTDIAPSDYPLFLELRKLLKGGRFFPTVISLLPRITGWAVKF